MKHIAVATGYSQVFRGIGEIITSYFEAAYIIREVDVGQASAVGIASAIFQKRLLVELRSRIHGSDAEQV